MASNYRQLSFVFNLTVPQTDWLMALMDRLGEDVRNPDGSLADPNPEQVRYLGGDLLDFAVDFLPLPATKQVEVWVHDTGEWANVDQIAAVLQALLVKFPGLQPIGFTWADTCSKPRIDEFGGGAVLISRDRVQIETTHDLLNRMNREAA